MSVPVVRYCVDTSAWLDGWQRYYPIGSFPTLWDRIEDLIHAQRLWWAEEVAHEIRDADLVRWLGPHTRTVVDTASIWVDATNILNRFNPSLNPKGIMNADPFVIAAAQRLSLSIVTGEKPSGGSHHHKLPDVCRSMGLSSMNLLGMIKREGWTF
jgi:hypothetical protein